MKLSRRAFLLFSGLTGLGLVSALKGCVNRTMGTPDGSAPAAGSANPLPGNSPQTVSSVASPGQPLLRFVVTADSGSGDENQYAVGAAMERHRQQYPYQLALLAGDNIYDNGEIEKIGTAFEKPYQLLLQNGVKFRACLGNHDIRTENGDRQVKYAAFNMPQRYYTFQESAVQFFVLDTNVNANWDAQLAWLEHELGRSTAPWKVVYGHHPIYSSGVYGTNSTFVKYLAPLFQKYGVQLYMNGHEHSYERTRPIAGTTYIITGHGGAYLRAVGKSEWTAYAVSRFGFTALEVYGDRMEVKAIGTDHAIFDQGTIPLKSA